MSDAEAAEPVTAPTDAHGGSSESKPLYGGAAAVLIRTVHGLEPDAKQASASAATGRWANAARCCSSPTMTPATLPPPWTAAAASKRLAVETVNSPPRPSPHPPPNRSRPQRAPLPAARRARQRTPSPARRVPHDHCRRRARGWARAATTVPVLPARKRGDGGVEGRLAGDRLPSPGTEVVGGVSGGGYTGHPPPHPPPVPLQRPRGEGGRAPARRFAHGRDGNDSERRGGFAGQPPKTHAEPSQPATAATGSGQGPRLAEQSMRWPYLTFSREEPR